MRTTYLRRIKDSIKPMLPQSTQRWLALRANIRAIKRGDRLVPEAELEQRYVEAVEYLKGRGYHSWDYLEFGVYNGSSLACMDRALKQLNTNGVRLFGFDSFEGLPVEATVDDQGYWRPGEFKMDMAFTLKFLRDSNVRMENVTLVKGWFNETLTQSTIEQLKIGQAGILMVDCDIYSSSKTALQFSKSLIGEQAIVFFDDWSSGGLADKNMGQKRALDEFLTENSQFRVDEFPNYGRNSKAFVLSTVADRS